MKLHYLLYATILLFSCKAIASPAECAMRNTRLLFPASGGFSLSPKDPNAMAFARPDGQFNFQIYVRNLSSGEERCISCAQGSEGPAVKLNKAAPGFLPDGQHLIVQVEMASHPYQDSVRSPGWGWFFNIWMINLDGSRWWQLTDYPHGPNDRYGVLTPQLSPTGKR